MIEPKRDTTTIKKWMLDEGLRQADITAAVGESQQLVNMTIHGKRNNRKVLRYLLERGCPVEALDLPEDMKEAA